jgi:hypothetical protein
VKFFWEWPMANPLYEILIMGLLFYFLYGMYYNGFAKGCQ